MEKQTVTISLEEYDNLVALRIYVSAIRSVVKSSGADYRKMDVITAILGLYEDDLDR